jgi:hypothetical protein
VEEIGRQRHAPVVALAQRRVDVDFHRQSFPSAGLSAGLGR